MASSAPLQRSPTNAYWDDQGLRGFNHRAYGGHHGNCGPDFLNRDVWSVAALFDEAIGVRLTCGC